MPMFCKKYFGFIFIFLVQTFILLPAESAERQNSFTMTGESVWRLSLREAIVRTLENNISIAVQKFNSQKKEQDIVDEKSIFDPVLSSEVSAGGIKEQVSSAFASPDVSKNDTQNWDITLSQKFATGLNYELSFNNEREETNSLFAGLNPQYSSDLTLTATQPLLKNFGIDINKKDIFIANNEKDISDLEFQTKVIDTISEVENVYWDLVFSIEDLKVKEKSLERAKDFERRVKAQVEVGTLAPLEILQAKSEVASREEDLLGAQDLIKDNEDKIKNIMNLNFNSDEGMRSILPTDPPKYVLENHTPLSDHISTALKKRPDYQVKKKELDNKNILLKYSENQLFPSIDLFGTMGLNGIAGDAATITSFSSGSSGKSRFGGGYGDTLDNVISRDFYEWEVGVKLEYPLGNRSAKSRATVARLDVQQQILDTKDLEKKIILEVREAVRQTKTDIQRVTAAGIARKFAEEKLSAEEKKFEVGLSTSFNVLEFQEDLAEEQSNEIRAIIDYNKSIIKLQQVLATILEENNIRMFSESGS